jgi:hypothetical protein
MKKMSRRELFKTGLVVASGAIVTSKLMGSAHAADMCDSAITAQGYVSDHTKVGAADKAKYTTHLTAVQKINKKAEPKCSTCKLYKPDATGGCGKCPMVMANGSKGKLVNENGWCKVFQANEAAIKKA